MSPDQIFRVRASWALVVPVAEAVAARFYERLFTLDPALRPLFAHADPATQRRKLVQTFAVVVAGLEDLGRLLPAVEALGRRHATYGVTAAHYDTVREAFLIGLGEQLAGRPDAAVAAMGQALERSAGSPVMAAGLAHALAVRGDGGEARTMLAALETSAEERRLLAYEVALVHLALGATDAAFAWLDRAYEERSAWLAYAAVEPRLDPIRGDERFAALLRALRLPTGIVAPC